jgi:energy-coupling factor transporter ATP-binding protein EcfA2
MDLAPSGFIAILGANGSGKSTLAHVLAGLLMPSSGTVTIDGVPGNTPSGLRQLRRAVGLIFQDPNMQITSSTVERELAFGLQNLGMRSDAMKDRVEAYLERFDLERYRKTSPHELSGGEKQRLAIAAVMILQPQYLILDEATALLPPRSKRALLDMAMTMRREHSLGILLITQSPLEALEADQVIVLRDGRPALSAPPRDAFSESSLLDRCHVPVPLRFRFTS